MATTPTLVTANGRPTVYYPLATPWPLGPGCASKTYRQSDEGTILAWDPYYGMHVDADAKTCYPPQVTSWWFQTEGQPTSIALGPTFACPEAYTAAQTLLEAGGMQHVFCCPSEYKFHVPQPNKPVFPSQCLSTATPGQTITYDQLTQASSGMTFIPTTSVVKSETVSIWGIPVNGYNFQASSTGGSSTGPTAAPTSTAGATSELPAPTATEVSREAVNGDRSSGTPLGVTVGVSVGVVLAVLALLGLVFLMWRRRRRRRSKNLVSEVEEAPVVEPICFEGRQFELPAEVTNKPRLELYGDHVHTKPPVYELPGSREKH